MAISHAITDLKFGHNAGKRLKDDREVMRFRLKPGADVSEAYIQGQVRVDVAFGDREPLVRIEDLASMGVLAYRIANEAGAIIASIASTENDQV